MADTSRELDKVALLGMVQAVLEIHQPTLVWVDSVIDAETGHTEELAIYSPDGVLVHAARGTDKVCEGCGVQRMIPWPCATAIAVGADFDPASEVSP